MDNGIDGEGHASGKRPRPLAQDSLGAVLAAESAVADRVSTTFELAGRPTSVNAFGDSVAFEHDHDAATLARRLADRAGDGERVTLIAPSDALFTARKELRAIARRRLPLVFHVL